MSRIINVTPSDDYAISIEFEHGNKLLFNMKMLVNTLPYVRLNDLDYFKMVKFDDKTVYWGESAIGIRNLFPIRLSVDNILCMLRD